MNRTWGGRASALVMAAVAVTACSNFLGLGGDDDPAPSPVAQGDASPATPAEDGALGPDECKAPAYDLAGCICAAAAATQICFQGEPGLKSACSTPGKQTCAPAIDGRLRWSECEGGSKPKPAETCFDDVDDDCDGRVNQGCVCSTSMDLCKPDMNPTAAPFTAVYTVFTVPSAPRANETFQLFIVSKSSLADVGLWKDNTCYGGGSNAPCANAGDGCSGWNVARFELKEPAGSYNFRVLQPNGTQGCSGPDIANRVVAVTS